MKNKIKHIMRNVTTKIVLTAALLKPISESHSLLNLTVASVSASHIQRRDPADVSPDISEELYETALARTEAYVPSGTGSLFHQQHKLSESDSNALIVRCG